MTRFLMPVLHLWTSFVFQLQSIVTSIPPFASRLPTFITDLRHPWIKENNKWLQRLDDPKSALCSLNSTLRNEPSERQYPSDLFRYLEIDNNRAGVDRPGWKNAVARLDEMLACPAALNDVEHFSIAIYVSDGQYGIGWPEPSIPPRQLSDLFIKVLSSMPHLRKLEWDTFENGIDDFKHAFETAGLILPSVRQLLLAPFADFLVNACPRTEDLRSAGNIGSSYFRGWPGHEPRAQLIEATKNLDNLTTFGMAGEWEIELLEELLRASPNLKTLMMDGELAKRYSWREPQDGGVLQNLVILSQFVDLQDLRLPASSGLGLGFDGGPGCGNAYFGREGQRYFRQVMEEDASTTETAGMMVLDTLPNLKALTIGNYGANISSNDDGAMFATWPWSSMGIHNWTMTNWPDRDLYPGEDDEESYSEEDD